MANEANTPAATGGLTSEQLTAAINAAVKPLTDKIAALEGNLGTVAGEMAARKQDELTRAEAAKAPDPKAKPEPLGADAVARIVADAIAADRKAQQEQSQKADAVKAAKAKIVAEKLGGDAELAAYLPDTADEAQLAGVADKLAAKVAPKVKLPGVASDRGTPPARQPVDYSKLNASQKVQMGVDQMLAGAATA